MPSRIRMPHSNNAFLPLKVVVLPGCDVHLNILTKARPTLLFEGEICQHGIEIDILQSI